MQVKTEDDVLILAGKDKGLTGEVIEADPSNGKVKVARRNMIVKHEQPNQVTGEDGQRIEREGWIDASNVALYVDGDDGPRPVRIGYKFVGEGGELYEDKYQARKSFGGEAPEAIHKVRIARQTGDVIDSVPEY